MGGGELRWGCNSKQDRCSSRHIQVHRNRAQSTASEIKATKRTREATRLCVLNIGRRVIAHIGSRSAVRTNPPVGEV